MLENRKLHPFGMFQQISVFTGWLAIACLCLLCLHHTFVSAVRL